MRRTIRASKLDTFLKYHDDESNYHSNPNGFSRMYDILDKYDKSNGINPVSVAFLKATPEDQDRMIELIAPGLRVGEPGYCVKLYYDALEGDAYDNKYANQAVIDVFEALFEEGIIDEYKFRTDL